MDTLLSDLRHGARRLLAHPGFSLAAIATLALGIGANTSIFSVVKSVLLAPLPYRDGEQLVVMQQHLPTSETPQGFSPIEVNALREGTRTLDGVVEYHNMWFILLGKKEPERVGTGVVSWSYFDLFGVRPAYGRFFTAEDEKPGAEAVLVLSNRYFQRAFGGDPSVVGKTFQMNDRPHTVIGVLPSIPQYPDENDVYMPTTACPFRSAEQTRTNPQARMTQVFGRVKPGVTLAAVKEDMEAISSRLQPQYPQAYPPGRGLVFDPLPLRNELTRQARPTFLLLLATTGLVLLIGCANVANLTLAQLLSREHEFSVRSALGASRVRLARQLLTEAGLLAAAGGLLGVLLAMAAVDLLVAYARPFTPRADAIAIDGWVLLFTLGVSAATALMVGLLPAIAPRSSLASALGGEARAIGSGNGRARGALIVAQVAVSFLLLIGAGLLVRSLLNLQNVDVGIPTERLMTMRVALNFTRYDTADKRREFHARLLERLKSRPGVTAAALAGTFPLNEVGPFNTNFVIEGRPVAPGEPGPQAQVRVASPEYFATVDQPILSGRAFTDGDTKDTTSVAIVSRSLARHHFGDVDVVGRRLSGDGGKNWSTIVGVVADVRQQLKTEPQDEVYRPIAQTPLLSVNPVVRTAGDPRALTRSLRDAVWEIDPQQPVDQVRTMEEVRRTSLAPPRLTALLLGLFAGVALVITGTGIAGVVAFSVGRRTQEIGIRMALGAETGDVLKMVLSPSLTLVAVGLTAGAAGAFALTRFLSALLFGIGPTDPLTFISVAIVLTLVAAAAGVIPARRATAIQPMSALRTA